MKVQRYMYKTASVQHCSEKAHDKFKIDFRVKTEILGTPMNVKQKVYI